MNYKNTFHFQKLWRNDAYCFTGKSKLKLTAAIYPTWKYVMKLGRYTTVSPWAFRHSIGISSMVKGAPSIVCAPTRRSAQVCDDALGTCISRKKMLWTLGLPTQYFKTLNYSLSPKKSRFFQNSKVA